jgi:hypothetical protein
VCGILPVGRPVSSIPAPGAVGVGAGAGVPDLGGLPALEVIIGLAFLYFLLSTVCSAINEGIANVLGWRAKTLEDAIRNMVGDPEVKRGWKEWFGRIHKKGLKDPDAVASERDSVRVPADLTSAVFDHWRIQALVRNPRSSARRRRRPSYLPPRAFSLAIAETLAKGAPDRPEGPSLWQQADDEILERAQAVLESLPEGQTRRVLQKAAANAGETLEGFRTQVETAFDDAMERASGWYKRKVQVVLLALAAAVAIGLNVDSVRVGTQLWNDDAVRTAVVAKATEKDPQQAADAVAQVEQLQLPVGWGAENAPDDLAEALRRIPGWLITIASLSLGAPFWFDLLSRLARLRGSGGPEKPRSLSDTAGTRAAGA